MSNKRHGTLYTGVTSNLPQRVWQHKEKATQGFTQKYNLNRLVYYDLHSSPEAAITREKRIKDWKRQWKTELIESQNPDWQDLYDSIIV